MEATDMQELFEQYIKTEKIMFKYARGKSARSGREFHVYHEIVFFIDGKAEFISENIHVDIVPGTVFVIPKETYHQFLIKEDHESYFRCVINFHDFPDISRFIELIPSIQMIMPTDSDIDYLFKKLINNVSSPNADKLLSAVLILLLNELTQNNSVCTAETIQNTFVRSAVDYINNHIDEKITIGRIAKECMISPSSLSHIFKKEMNISLHKFITKKRLINAYHKIMSGEKATIAAAECGFNDYSGFYKQYKKMFNVAPSEKITDFSKE